MNHKSDNRIRRHKRVRAKISGTPARPRLSVFRSNKHTHLQLIDDSAGKTIAAVSTANLKTGKTKLDQARAAAEALVKKAQEAGIKELVFDRGGYKYHGRVSQIADVIRSSGIKV